MNGPASASPTLLFDLDGCLVDSLPAIRTCWERTLPRFGSELPSGLDLRAFAGPPVDEVARRLLPGAPAARIAELIAVYRRCSASIAGEVAAFPGVPELLDALRERGVRLAVATSKSIEVAEPTLEALGLRGHFTIVEGTPVDALGADKATVVGRVLAGLDARDDRASGSLGSSGRVRPLGLVGDRSHDVVGAHAHGLPCFGALWGYGGREELERAGADALLAAPADVLTLV